jgi:hemoglobin
MRKSTTLSFLVLLLAVLVTGVAVAADKPAAKPKSLYERLGGKSAIVAVVDEFVARVGADEKINVRFAATTADPKRLAAFKGTLVDQICEAAGGPCTYKGKDMKSAHAGMGIAGDEFDALVADLVGALDKFKVGAAEKDQLLGVLGPMRKDIVEKK